MAKVKYAEETAQKIPGDIRKSLDESLRIHRKAQDEALKEIEESRKVNEKVRKLREKFWTKLADRMDMGDVLEEISRMRREAIDDGK